MSPTRPESTSSPVFGAGAVYAAFVTWVGVCVCVYEGHPRWVRLWFNYIQLKVWPLK